MRPLPAVVYREHSLLPHDAILPGKFPEGLTEGSSIAFLCYLTAPSEAKYAYLERRIALRLPAVKIMGLAWADKEGTCTMINPEHALALLPAAGEDGSEPAPVPPR